MSTEVTRIFINSISDASQFGDKQPIEEISHQGLKIRDDLEREIKDHQHWCHPDVLLSTY